MCEVTGHPKLFGEPIGPLLPLDSEIVSSRCCKGFACFSSETRASNELLVNLYFEQNEMSAVVAQVIPLLRNLAEIDPSEFRYHLNHALALRALGESDEALVVAKRAVLQHPDRVELQLLRSQLLVHQRAGWRKPFRRSTPKDVRKRFWKTEKFLLEYMDLAYRTGNEFVHMKRAHN